MNDASMNGFATSPTIGRRQLLLAGSAAAVGALMLGGDVFTGPSGLERLANSAGPRIPVAFVEGSAGATSLAEALGGAARRALPAAGMRAGEALAGRAALLSVLGFASGRHGQADFGHATVLLDALVPSSSNHGRTIPFYAFTFRREPAVSQSTLSRMHVASGGDLRVGLQLVTTGATGGSASTVFTSHPQRSMPTFRPGIYLLGLEPGMWADATDLPALDDPAWAGLPSLVVAVEAEAAR
jgi:hypothetical protein